MSSPALPGAELISQGLEDLARGTESIEALLVSIAAPRLRSLGYAMGEGFPEPELGLYRLLAEQHGNRIVSFQRAAACGGFNVSP